MPELLLAVYASAELILALQISLSNFVVILVYLRSKHIRTPTNAYIFSLALTDFLAGALGIPLTVFSVLTRWPGSFYACLAIHLILCVLCTVSTLHLMAMAVDKYLTICLKRFDHQRTSSSSSVRKSRANLLIVSAWLSGAAIAGLPMVDGFGFASRTIDSFRGQCHFTVVVDYRYLVFVIFFATIILPSLVIAYCYVSIYAHIRNEERQIKCLLRASERQRRINARRKLIRILLILVLTYALCWYPLYLINTADLFLPPQFHAGPFVTLAAVVLSHLNCALNPVIYAYGVPGFKHSLRRFLPIRSAANGCAAGVNPCNNNTGGTGSVPPQFPPLKPPFVGHNGIPMGKKRAGVQLGNDDAPSNNHSSSRQQMAPMARTVSTVNAVPPPPSLMTVQPSSQSLLETRRVQFGRHGHGTNKKGSDTSQHSIATSETEYRSDSGGGPLVGKQTAARSGGDPQQPSSSSSSSSVESNSLSAVEEHAAAAGSGKRQQSREGGQVCRPKRGSSFVGWWNLFLFNGQWMVKKSRRKASKREEETLQRLGLIAGKVAQHGPRRMSAEEESSSSALLGGRGAGNQ